MLFDGQERIKSNAFGVKVLFILFYIALRWLNKKKSGIISDNARFLNFSLLSSS
jgi:hypothetical protein